MEDKKKVQYKEYIGLTGERKDIGKKIEGSIIPLVGGLLDYIEIMLETLDMDEDKTKRAFGAIRKKVLRDGNDSVRSLLSELHSYNIKKLSRDIIQFNKQ